MSRGRVPQSGENRLRSVLRRLAQATNAIRPAPVDRAEPVTDIEHEVERRLRDIEAAVNNQNRLMLIAIVSVVAELTFQLLKP